MSVVIQTQQLCRYFGEDDIQVKALNQVDLAIKKGEFSAIIGPSGSGKSTLLHLIGGLDNPTSGSVELAGTNIANMSANTLSDFRRDHIGFVFQAYNLIPVLSAEENIEYIMLLQGVAAKERRQRVADMLGQVGLQGLGHRRPAQLSGGQQQRVAIARAIVSQPDIVLADEPTANLDSSTGIELLEMMRELNQRLNLTFLFSTHDDKIMQRADRLIHLEDGVISQDEHKASESICA